jgi:hypothetical protein
LEPVRCFGLVWRGQALGTQDIRRTLGRTLEPEHGEHKDRPRVPDLLTKCGVKHTLHSDHSTSNNPQSEK